MCWAMCVGYDLLASLLPSLMNTIAVITNTTMHGTAR